MTRVTMAACLGAALLVVSLRLVAAEPVTVTVRQAWARATPPGAAVAAVYFTIVGGTVADRLLGATTPRAGMSELHAVTHESGMTRMRPAEGVVVPAHGNVVLAPDGLHLMLMDLSQPLVPGETFKVQLRFAHAGLVDVPVQVVAAGSSGPAKR
jgi:copper(I)-binding protein